MDCAPNVNIFRELQVVHDTGYFSSHVSPEEDWQQVRRLEIRKGGFQIIILKTLIFFSDLL